MSFQQLQERLYPRLQQVSQGRLFVTVIRATNLSLPGIHWFPPQAVVALGNFERRSPLGEAFGANPIFDWRLELPFTGRESHLTFEVICEGELLGSSILPLADVLSTPGVRSLVLAEAASPPELLVSVSSSMEGDLQLAPQQERSAELLRMKTSQLRVTLRTLRVEERLSLENGSNKICAFVVASCGQQTARTKAAFLTASREDREKFVFTDPPNTSFNCGDLLRGKLDKYKRIPSLEERRTTDRQYGYRLRTDDHGLHVTYSNVQFTFWYQKQELIELSVFDDLFMYYPDNLVASGALDLNEAFRKAFTEEGMPVEERPKAPKVLMHVNLAPSIASLRPVVQSRADGDGGTGSSTSSRIAGEIQLEVEFLEEAIACPTPLESTFRQALARGKQAEQEHRESLQYLAEITAGSITSSGLPALEDLFQQQRECLARLCCTCAVVTARRIVEHEERVVPIFGERLEEIVRDICDVLLEDVQLQADLLNSARSAIPQEAVDEAADAYKRSCRGTSQMEHLLPLATLLCLLHSKGALLRSSLQRAAKALDGPVSGSGALFLELLERHLVSCGELDVSEPLTLTLGSTGPTTSSTGLSESELQNPIEQQEQLRAGRSAMYSNFLPQIDSNRLIEREMEEWRLEALPGKYPYIVPGSVCIGALCGALVAISYVETAVIMHTFDTRVLCHPDVQHMALMRASCWVMKDSYLDKFMEWVAESPAWFKAIFLVSGALDGKTALTNMRRRVLRLRELRLESVGPALSPHKVICISGFLRSLSDLVQPWMVDLQKPWTSAQVHFLRFDSEVLFLLGQQLLDVLSRDLKRTEQVVRLVFACSNLISFSNRLVSTLLDELGDLLDRAAARAEQVGKLLARQLLEARKNARRQAAFTVSLLGFSSGGVVVQSCLKELHEMVKDGQHVAGDIICDAVMLGSPSRALDEEWCKLRQLVSGRFVNGFFAQDSILLSHQFRRGGAQVAGCSPLHAADVENIPMDPFITTHNEYPEQMPLILQRIFQEAP